MGVVMIPVTASVSLDQFLRWEGFSDEYFWIEVRRHRAKSSRVLGIRLKGLPTMLQFWIVRAGITEIEKEGRILGTLDVPLHPDAAQQIDHVTRESSGHALSAVYSSTGQSSIETAESLCRAWGLKYKASDLLRNLDLGLWQGLLLEEVKRKQPKVFRQWQEHPETVCPPEGEMLLAARDRIDTFLSKIYKKYKSGVIVIVAADPCAAIVASVLQQTQLQDVLPRDSGRKEHIQIISPALTNA